jgi:hypothetical protein
MATAGAWGLSSLANSTVLTLSLPLQREIITAAMNGTDFLRQRFAFGCG